MNETWIAFGIAIGASFGIIIDALAGNIALGIAFGAGDGVVLGTLFKHARRRRE